MHSFIFNVNEILRKYGPVKGLAILLLFIFFSLGSNWLWNNILPQPTTSSSNSTAIASVQNLTASASEVTGNKRKRFSDNLSMWKPVGFSKVDGKGFYCPTSYPFYGYPSSFIWYKSLVAEIFSDPITFDFSLMSAGYNDNTVPSFIFAMGDNPRIFRFYLPESSPQIVGFERIDLNDVGNGLRREPSGTLKDPLKFGESISISLTVRSQLIKGNEVAYTFNVVYLSTITGDKTEDSFYYSFKLPNPDPETSKVKLGFGTFKNGCIKPISYEGIEGGDENG